MAEGKSILTPHQKRFLDLISREKYFTDRFYFTGGTALAEFYLKHRLSEDLDFFSEKQEVNPVSITRFFESEREKLGIVKFDTRRVLGLFSYFFTFKDGEILKVDFNYYPFLRIERGLKFGALTINSIHDIAVDKVHTIALKPRSRDYIDLYFILKSENFSFRNLLIEAKTKFDWDITAIELGTRLTEATQVSDYPRMLKPIEPSEWQGFFVEEASKLRDEIFEK